MNDPTRTVCAIMQPTYLPWVGYYDLIEHADIFVFLDDVQFSKQSWQQRNRIRTPKDLEWLTVPVIHKGRFGQLICDTEIQPDADFPRKHLRSLEMNYSRAPYFEKFFADFSNTLVAAAHSQKLADLNMALIAWTTRQLGIDTPIVKSSDLQVEGKRSEYVINICKKVNATEYLSPPGAAEYLKEDREQFRHAELPVFIQSFIHPEWRQSFSPFMPYCSAIDLIFNMGTSAREILLSGHRNSIPLDAFHEIVQPGSSE